MEPKCVYLVWKAGSEPQLLPNGKAVSSLKFLYVGGMMSILYDVLPVDFILF